MSGSKPFSLWLLLFLLCLLPASTQAEKAELRIGVIVPLTGNMAFAGTEIRDAMLLAQQELGPTQNSYRLFFEDNALDLKQSVAAAQKLLSINKVDAVVTLWPPTANVVAPLTEAKGVLHYTIAWDPTIAQRHKYVLSHQAMVGNFVAATLNLLQQQGHKRVIFFHVDESGFNMGAEILRQRGAEIGMEIIDAPFVAGQNDFRSEITRLRRSQPDAFLIWAVQPEMDILLRQLQQLAPNVAVTGFFDVAQDLSLIDAKPYVSEVAGTNSFNARFRKHYGRDAELKGANAYDIFRLLVRVFEALGPKASAAERKAWLTQVRDYDGAVGKVDIASDGNSSYPVLIKVATSEEKKVVGNFDNR